MVRGSQCQSGGNAQSTKPFHAVEDILRAVSTVPPRTTSFYHKMRATFSTDTGVHIVH
jgi:hypothetical protein